MLCFVVYLDGTKLRFGFSQRCDVCSSGMWRCVVGGVIPDVSNLRVAFMSKDLFDCIPLKMIAPRSSPSDSVQDLSAYV